MSTTEYSEPLVAVGSHPMPDAIVLAGGLGTRLRSEVPDLPKPMAPVDGQPFLQLLLTGLAHKGFRRVVLSVGYRAEQIVQHFGNRFGPLELLYAREETPLGTGGALRLALANCASDHAFVFNGDTWLDLDAVAVEAQWRQQHAPIIVAREVDDTARYGRLDVVHGRVTGFASGVAGPGLINAGCYVVPVDLLAVQPAAERFSFEADFLASVVASRHFDVFVAHGQFIDIGVPEDYRRAQTELRTLTS